MYLSPLNLKANGVCPHQLKMVQQVLFRQLQLELQAQIKRRDDRLQEHKCLETLLGSGIQHVSIFHSCTRVTFKQYS